MLRRLFQQLEQGVLGRTSQSLGVRQDRHPAFSRVRPVRQVLLQRPDLVDSGLGVFRQLQVIRMIAGFEQRASPARSARTVGPFAEHGGRELPGGRRLAEVFRSDQQVRVPRIRRGPAESFQGRGVPDHPPRRRCGLHASIVPRPAEWKITAWLWGFTLIRARIGAILAEP